MKLTPVNTAIFTLGLVATISPLYANDTFLTARTVSVPYPRFLISGEGLALKPLDQSTTYATQTLSNASSPFKEYNLRPGYSGAYRLEGVFIVPNTRNDLTLNWMSFRNTTTDNALSSNSGSLSASLINTSNLSVPIDGSLYNISGPDSVDARLAFKVQNANLEYGQNFKAYRSDVRIHAGVGYASIRRSLSETAANAAPEAVFDGGEGGGAIVTAKPYSLKANQSSKFWGIGPRLGADLYYLLGKSSFSLVAHGSAALLAGTVNETFSVSDSNSVVDTTASYAALVPNFNLRLGVGYSHAFGQNAGAEGGEGASISSVNTNRVLSIEAGWEVDDYIDPIRTGKYNSTAAATGVVDGGEGGAVIAHANVSGAIVPNQDKWKSNLGLSGLYVKLSYLF